MQGIVVKGGEPQLVFYFQFATFQILRVDFYRCNDLLVLLQTRARRLVRVNQTIKAEVVVIRVVAVIAAKFVPHVAIVVFRLNTVIAPFPDVVPLNAVVLVKDILIFG